MPDVSDLAATLRRRADATSAPDEMFAPKLRALLGWIGKR